MFILRTPYEQAIEDGTISVVSSDHSPAPPADKKLEEGDFLKAWGGISGLQFSLPATWTKMSKLGMDFVKLAGESGKRRGKDGGEQQSLAHAHPSTLQTLSRALTPATCFCHARTRFFQKRQTNVGFF